MLMKAMPPSCPQQQYHAAAKLSREVCCPFYFCGHAGWGSTWAWCRSFQSFPVLLLHLQSIHSIINGWCACRWLYFLGMCWYLGLGLI